jgi:hypothetical protein
MIFPDPVTLNRFAALLQVLRITNISPEYKSAPGFGPEANFISFWA